MVYVILIIIFSCIALVVGGLAFDINRSLSIFLFAAGGFFIFFAAFVSFDKGVNFVLDTSICPVCQEKYEDGYKYCPIDGAKLEFPFNKFEPEV